MKRSSVQCIALCTSIPFISSRITAQTVVNTQTHTHEPLFFDSDGTFKILQLADLHFGENAWEDWGPEQDLKSINSMRAVLAYESPSFVVFSGDQITDNNIISNQTLYWEMAVMVCVEMNIPWAMIFGNHDDMAIDADIEDYFREQHINTSTHTTASTRNTLLQLDRVHALSYTQSFLATQSGESLSTYYLDIHAPLSDGGAVKDGDVPGKDGTAEDKQTAPDANTYTDHETPGLLKSRVATRLWFMDSGGGVLPLSVTGEQLDWLTDTAENLAERAHEERPGEASINRRSTNAHTKSTGTSAHAKVQVARDSHRQIDGRVPGFLFVHAPPPEVMQCHCSRTFPSPSPDQNVARSRGSIYRPGLSKSVSGRDLSASSTSAASNSTCFGTRKDSIDPFSVDYQTGDSGYKNGIESNISLFGATIADAGIKLVAFGHNHGNDFCCSVTVDGQEQHKDSMSSRQLGLCFGRHSGYGGYGEKRWAKGARVYELDLSVTHVATHVRLEDGTVVSQGVVPNFFSDAGISNTQGEGNADPHAHRHEHGSKPSYVTPVVMFGLMIVSSMIVAVWSRWNVRSSRNRKPEEIEQLPMARIAPRPLISDSVTSDVLDSDRLLSSD